jgi:hypothetical protein
MKEIITKITDSFTLDKGGFSARKLSSFVIIALVVIAHIKWIWKADFSMLTEILMIDYSFILACLGLVTWQNVKEYKVNE